MVRRQFQIIFAEWLAACEDAGLARASSERRWRQGIQTHSFMGYRHGTPEDTALVLLRRNGSTGRERCQFEDVRQATLPDNRWPQDASIGA